MSKFDIFKCYNRIFKIFYWIYLIKVEYLRLLRLIYRTKNSESFELIDQKLDPQEGINPAIMNALYVRTRNAFSIAYSWIAAYFELV